MEYICTHITQNKKYLEAMSWADWKKFQDKWYICEEINTLSMWPKIDKRLLLLVLGPTEVHSSTLFYLTVYVILI